MRAIDLPKTKNMIERFIVTIIGSLDPSESTIKTVTIEGVQFVLSHYSLRSWTHAFRRVIHLFGHSHGRLPPYYRSFDVGVDNNNFFPFSFKQIMEKVASLPNADTFAES